MGTTKIASRPGTYQYQCSLVAVRKNRLNGSVIPVIIALAAAFGVGHAPTMPPLARQQQSKPAVRATTACAAITRADLERELGRKVSEAIAEEGPNRSTCDYSTRFGQITITAQKLDGAIDLTSAVRDIVAALPEAESRLAETGVPNVKAYFVDIGTAGTQLHVVRNGQDHLLISVLGCGTPSEVSKVATTLAQLALKRLFD